MYLYHVTLTNRLPSIQREGLVSDRPASLTPHSLTDHAKGGVFFANFEGLKYWIGVAANIIGYVNMKEQPVVLRTTKRNLKCVTDWIGTEDSSRSFSWESEGALAFKCQGVTPTKLQVLGVDGWYRLVYADIDALTQITDYDSNLEALYSLDREEATAPLVRRTRG